MAQTLSLRQQLRNRNVWLNLVFTGINSMVLGIWGSILSNYLKLLTGSLSMVGYSETIQGVSKVCFSFIAGCSADSKKGGKEQRARVLAMSGGLSFLAMGISIMALYVDRDHNYPDANWTPAYWMMVVALCFWGIFAGVYYPAMMAILADSVETGNRTTLYTYRWMLQMTTRALGPLLGALLFKYVYGDQWELENVRNVFLAGMVATSLPAMLLFFFDDSKTLGMQSEALAQSRGAVPTRKKPTEAQPLINAVATIPNPNNLGLEATCCGCSTAAIPWLLAFSDLMFCFGQGMTVKYFSIYFADIVLLSPSTTMIVSAMAPVAAAFFSEFSGRLSRAFGRVQLLIVFRLGGVIAMTVLGLFSHDDSHPDPCTNHNNATGLSNMTAAYDHASFNDYVGGDIRPMLGGPPLKNHSDSLSNWQLAVIILYIIQTGFFNSTQPLTKSILMDYVPKKSRGRWSAVDSLTSFGWSVTTIFGSLIVNSYCYSYLFLVSAGCMFISQMPFWWLLPLVPVKQKASV